MPAVKGHYRHGRVELDTPTPGLDETEVMVAGAATENATDLAFAPDSGVANSHTKVAWDKIDTFGAAGLATFFGDADDENVDWREIFDVKGR